MTSYISSFFTAPPLTNQDESKVESYEKYHSLGGGDLATRKSAYEDMVNKYYDLATDFYEFGWGQSFHFAHRVIGESLRESIKRHEHYLSHKLGLKKGMKVLDVGCGVGGPLREIATFSGASIVGLNNNAYQIKRGEHYNQQSGHDATCSYLKADFMHIPCEDASFDAIYQIEATCHAPDKTACYKELFRVLKPGGLFAGYDWCMTDAFDASNPTHQQTKAEIEVGNGLPDILTCKQCVEALKAAGFEILETEDLAKTSQLDWYEPMAPKSFSISGFRTTTVGRFCTRNTVWALEKIGLAPKGSCRTALVLETAAVGLAQGGADQTFTPMFFYVARKPE